MTRRTVTVILTLFLAVSAYPQKNELVERTFNWGFELGCGTTGMYMHKVGIGGYDASDNYSRQSGIGYMFSTFGRANMGKFYIQTGFSLFNDRTSISFPYREPQSDMDMTGSFSVEGIYFQVPLMVGFNIVKQHPYSFSVFAGPRFSTPWASECKAYYSGFGNSRVSENLNRINFSLTAGVCCSISNVLMDFGFDYGLTKQSDGTVSPGFYNPQQMPVIMDRCTGTLYFSIGLLL